MVQIDNICRQQIKFAQMFGFNFERLEKLWEKKKMLVPSIFSFSYNVFKRLLSQTKDCVVEASEKQC